MTEGAIYAVGTSLSIEGLMKFTYNVAENGGAMYLDQETSLTLQTDTDASYGGDIYSNPV